MRSRSVCLPIDKMMHECGFCVGSYPVTKHTVHMRNQKPIHTVLADAELKRKRLLLLCDPFKLDPMTSISAAGL